MRASGFLRMGTRFRKPYSHKYPNVTRTFRSTCGVLHTYTLAHWDHLYVTEKMKCKEYGIRGLSLKTLRIHIVQIFNKLVLLCKPICLRLKIEKTLAYCEIRQFSVNYKSVKYYSTGFRGHNHLTSIFCRLRMGPTS